MVAGFVLRFKKAIVLVAALVTLAAAYSASRLELDLNLLNLLPRHDPQVRTFFQVTAKVGLQSLLVIILEPSPAMPADQVREAVDSLAVALAGSDLIARVRYRAEPDIPASVMQEVAANLPLFITTDQMLQDLAFRLSDEQIRRQVAENRNLLAMSLGLPADELILADPLGIRKIFKAALSDLPAGQAGEYFKTDDGGRYFILVEPRRPAQDVDFSRRLMTTVKKLVADHLARFQGPDGPMDVFYAGGYPIAVADQAATKRDIQATLLTSFCGVMLLFALVFRSFRALVFIGLTLAAAITWSLGLAGVIFGRLNLLTCIFACVLAGLGIDFAIHFINAFSSPSWGPAHVAKRLEAGFSTVASGVILGAVTTAAAFYAIAFSDFGGFRQLGLLTANGIICCLAAMLIVLPALLAWSAPAALTNNRGHTGVSGFGLPMVLSLVRKRPRLWLGAFLVLMGFLAVAGRQVRFNENLRNLRPAASQTFKAQQKVARWMGGSTDRIMLVVAAGRQDLLLDKTSRVHKALAGLQQQGRLGAVAAPGRFLAPPRRQQATRDFIRSHPGAFDLERIRSVFYQSLEANGFRPLKTYRTYFRALARGLGAETALVPSDLHNPAVRQLLQPFFFSQDGIFKAITYVTPAGSLWHRADLEAFEEMIAKGLRQQGLSSSDYHLTGTTILTGRLKQLIIAGIEKAIWISAGAILLVLLLYYRSLKYCCLACVPLAATLVGLPGIMALAGIDFNFLNLIVLPMIIGIGIDDGIHLTNTYRRPDGHDLVAKTSITGRAVVLTTLTTLISFGSLSIAHYPGLKGMGLVAVIGLATCLLASILLLPAIFFILSGRPDS